MRAAAFFALALCALASTARAQELVRVELRTSLCGDAPPERLAVVLGAELHGLGVRAEVGRERAPTLLRVETLDCARPDSLTLSASFDGRVLERTIDVSDADPENRARTIALVLADLYRELTEPADPVAPDTVAPDPVAPDPVAPDPVAPDPVAPDTVAPDTVAPDTVAAEPVSEPAEPAPEQPDPAAADALRAPTLAIESAAAEREARPAPRGPALVISLLAPIVPADPSVFGGARVGLEMAFDEAAEWSVGVGADVRGARGDDPLGHIELLLVGLGGWLGWMGRIDDLALGAAFEARVSLAYAWATASAGSVGAGDEVGLTADLALLARARWHFTPAAALGVDAGVGFALRGFEARAASERRVIGWGGLFIPLRLLLQVAL